MRYDRLIAVALGVVALCGASAEAAKWSRTYGRQLPDSAFAAVETSPNGQAIRRLPHHNARGNLDVPHLCNAISRLGQVKWIDPVNAEVARRHLRDHQDQIDRGACRAPKAVGR